MRFLNEKLNIKTVILLFPIFFLIHDTEEIFTMEKWMIENSSYLYSKVPYKFQFLIESAQLTTKQVTVAVLVELFIIILVSIMLVRSIKSQARVLLFTAFIMMLFLNVFTHISQSVAYQGYTPGVITAIFFSLPYSVYMLYRLFLENVLKKQLIIASFFLSFLLFPIVMFAHFVGKLVA